MDEEIKIPEKKISAEEQAVHFDWDKEKKVEKKESSEDEKIISEELKREIELMQIDENLKKEAEQKANKIQFLADDDKLKQLLVIAKEKGVLTAIQTAKKMNDPYLLDTLHDILAKGGYYQKFIK
ncbi:MAG: DUF3798 domain-containing protein [Candidatus Staskawiczbacteria bacterium]|nr:DUF3798 domain-containing protein [Candidatus Staskawiczbacteria bacterium]